MCQRPVLNHRMNGAYVFLRKTIQILFLLVLLSPLAVSAKESIARYEVDITPKLDGTFTVVETIYYNFGRDYRHGIYREIPLTHAQPASSYLKERYIDVDLQQVTMDDHFVEFVPKTEGDVLTLRIGDPNEIQTGEHKYVITYEVDGGYHYFDGRPAELYWNAIGTEWDIEIDKAEVTVHNKEQILSGEAACYQGGEGSNESCSASSSADFSFIHVVNDIGNGTGITVAYALIDTVEVHILERYRAELFIFGILILVIVGLGYKAYQYKTEFRTGRSIIPQYEPYEGLKPMYTGVLMDDTLNPQDITACIVYLAEQGYLKIKKTKSKVLFFFEVDDYEITLLKAPDSAVSKFQSDVLDLLFTGGLVAGKTTTLNDLKGNQRKQRENQHLLQQLRSDLKAELVEAGYIKTLSMKTFLPAIGIIALVILLLYLAPSILAMIEPYAKAYIDEVVFSYVAVAVGLLIVALLITIMAIWRRRTRKGYEALDHLKGFKDFLSTTEKERYKFHNAPDKSPEQFMQYLPYAIAFGVEKEWGEVFKNITIPDPEWYDGGSAGTFSAKNLTTSLGAFSTAFAASSGSSGSSGSGGGGSVGGGSGGGGGGSW